MGLHGGRAARLLIAAGLCLALAGCGLKRPEAARVLLDLHDRAEGLSSVSNALAKAVARIGHERDEAAERANEYAEAYASATNSIAALRIYYTEATNRTAIAEARAARLDAFRAYLVEQRDNARLQTTKALYQALIDRIDAGGL